jgi:hypothetical protein
MHAWHAEAIAGIARIPPPHVSPHSLSHFPAMHAASGAIVGSVPLGWSMAHCDRHWSSPLQPPRQDSRAMHVGLAWHAFDGSQQLALTHDAHDVVP